MEYGIHELAELAGVTTRTLRWYDKIGLLKPIGIGENGYRRYGGAEVDRLQQILLYRALGVELAQIRSILDDPGFDRLAALKNHLSQAGAAKERHIVNTRYTFRNRYADKRSAAHKCSVWDAVQTVRQRNLC